ncbi:MAG: hypothetical protein QOF60_2980 [Actinomycetota bacterium]|nr:hypothetical protein [Actinomycetota bacterium]
MSTTFAAPPQVAREGLALAAVTAGAGLVLGLWWHDTGALKSVADELTAAGRITGLLGTYLLLVEVLLLARIPFLDRVIGMDRLTVWHRRNGEYVVGLLCAHAVFVTLGYAMADGRNPLAELWVFLRSYPDMLAATVALVMLVGIGGMSARAVRRKVAYPTWYFVHLYVYPATVLAFAHQLASGDQFATHPLSRAFWIALHLGTAALLIGYRVVQPVVSNARHRLVIERVDPQGPGVFSLTISGRRMDELHAESGQFFLWRFLTRDGWWQAHPFSLSAAPDGRRLRITIEAAGDHTTRMARLRPGTRVVAEGPYGALTPRRRRRRKVVLVAGGIGVTPLRALLESLPAGPGDLSFLYRANSREQLVHRDELEALAAARGARLAYLLGPRRPGHDHLSPEVLRAQIPDIAEHDAYVCGSPGFVDWAVRSLRKAGVGRHYIHVERFEL